MEGGEPEGHALSLHELVSKVWPSLDTYVPASSGSKRFRRPRLIPGKADSLATVDRRLNDAMIPSSTTNVPASINNNTVTTTAITTATTTATNTITTNTITTSTAATGATSNLNPSATLSNKPMNTHPLPSDMAVAAAAVFSDAVDPTLTSAGQRNMGVKRRVSPDEHLDTMATSTAEGETAAETTLGGARVGGASFNKHMYKKRKRVRFDHTGDDDHSNKPGNNYNHNYINGHKSFVNRKQAGFAKWRPFKNAAQMLVRNLDATPDLVGASADEDFSTLLLQHVEHKNMLIERDLEKQKQIIEQAQKKQTELLAAQAAQAAQTAQLTNSQTEQATGSQGQQQQRPNQQQQHHQPSQQYHPPQQQQHHQPSQQYHPPQQLPPHHQSQQGIPTQQQHNAQETTQFMPRKNCRYFMRGSCPKGDDCTYKHDVAARDANMLAPESEEIKRARGVCKYVRKGACHKGPLCRYTHDLKQVPCLFYHLKGVCDNGVLCRFGHSPLSEEQLRELRF
ncbi:MAG: hypothetical protein J3Q66DRAFT_293450 [Benniella sp.]|nr:MAG: hypothetical protein J3Q66DRAFT_293450 [Benniella sp.]